MSQTATGPVLAYISAIRWPSPVPSAHRTASFISAIARSGVPTNLIVASADHGFDGRHGDGLEVIRREYGIEPPSNLRVFVIDWPFWKPAASKFVFYLQAERIIRKLKRESGLNVIMTRDNRALSYLSRWQRQGIKVTFDTHDFYMDIGQRDNRSSSVLQRYHQAERKFAPSLDGMITLLKTQADLYKAHLPTVPVHPTLPGVDKSFPVDPERLKHKTLGLVGTLVSRMGVEEILEAFGKLDLPDWKLLMIGGRNRDEIDSTYRMAAKYGVDHQLEITGWVSVPEMRRHLERISIALLPLRDTFFNRYLTAPSKLFDYMVHAIPVVASDLPCIREILGEAGIYVTPDSTDDLAQKIQTLAGSPARYQALAEATARRAVVLTWDRRGADVRDFLTTVVNSPSP
ncbi:MAG: glycosyltransferase family 4 protein [bacterium]|nr:glycosyltransferase family 4 protein [bacterium]